MCYPICFKKKIFNILTFILFFILLCSCSVNQRKYRVGVSQCSQDEWREKQNSEMIREAALHGNIQLEVRSVNDDSQKQINDLKYFINNKFDLIIVSPNEAKAITPIVEDAYQKGIPIIVTDRKIQSNKYTAFIGADNTQIGEMMGEHILTLAKEPLFIYKINGLEGSTSAMEREQGLDHILAASPNIKIVGEIDASWKKEVSEEKMDSVFSLHPNINLIVAQNDRMAIGAYAAAVKHGVEKKMKFIGVDALVDKEKGGVNQVLDRHFEATFIYPTGGEKVIQVATQILEGKPYNKETTLLSAMVDSTNARIMFMQDELIKNETKKVADLSTKVDAYLALFDSQRLLLYSVVAIAVLLLVICVVICGGYNIKVKTNGILRKQNDEIIAKNDQLVKLSRELEDATHAKLAFFTNISHDFRTPLTLISDPLNQILSSTNLNEEQHSFLKMISRNVTVLLRLVNQILDFRKFESGKLGLRLSEFDVVKCVDEWIDGFKNLAVRKHICFNVKLPEEPVTLIADSEKIERIIYNLLSNAFKFTPENGRICLSVSTIYHEHVGWLRLVITDNGLGMSQEHISHIFDNFYQIDVHYSGSGIGLALVKAFVELHHGTINVTSEVDKGSEFQIDIPLINTGELDAGTSQNGSLEALKNGAILNAEQENIQAGENININDDKKVVLVIDDNEDVRNYVKSLLLKDYRVIEAANGKEGLECALKNVPDAIICDVMMPVMNGIDCCEQLKKSLQTSHIPVMMLTAYVGDEQKVEGYECGADSFIAKPFNSDILKTRLRNLLDNRTRMQEFYLNTVLGRKNISVVEKSFVDELKEYIDKNLSNPELNVNNLSGEFHLSRAQFYRKTKALTGYSANELVKLARLNRAASMLVSTEKSISQISYEVGFKSPAYFSKTYKDHFSESPTDVQARMKYGVVHKPMFISVSMDA